MRNSLVRIGVVLLFHSTVLAQPPLRKDSYGDPLPNGAVVRLGTVGLREAGASAIAFSADGRKLISFGSERIIRTWDSATGRLLEEKPLPTVLYTPVAALSPNGKWLAFQDTSNRQQFYLWDVDKHELRHRFALNGRGWGHAAAFSPDSSTLVTTQENGSIQAWDVQSGKGHLVSRREGSRFTSLSFTREGKLATVSNDEQAGGGSATVALWDLRKNVATWNFSAAAGVTAGIHDAHIAQVSPDGKIVAIWGHRTSALTFWDTATGELAAGWKSPGEGFYGAPRFASDGKTVFIGSAKGVVQWDPIAGKAVQTLSGFHSRNLIVAPDGKTAAATVGDGFASVLYLWDFVTGKASVANNPDRGHLDPIRSVAFSRDGQTIASASTWNEVLLWDASTGRVLHRVPGINDPWALTFSPDGRQLFVRTASSIEELEVSSGKKIRSFAPARKDVRAIEMNLSADGTLLAALCYVVSDTSEKCLFQTWEVSSGKLLRTVNIPAPKGHGSAFSRFNRDNSWLVNPEGQILSVESGKEIASLPTERWSFGSSIAISKDGALIAANVGLSAGNSQKPTVRKFAVKVWEQASLQLVCDFETTQLSHLEFTHDGRRLVSADADSIQVWDLVSEKQVFQRSVPFRFRYGKSFASAIRLSPDGRNVATGLPDTTVLLWALPAPAKEQTPPLSLAQLKESWTDLAGADARRAFLASLKLASAPEQFLPLARERLKPAKAPAADEIKQLVADLADASFPKRQAAAKRLGQFGPEADAVLRSVMPAEPSLELQRRLENHFAGRRIFNADDLLHVRAVRVLEEINSADARKLLEVLAAGAPEAWRTRAAQAALTSMRSPQ